MTVGSSEDLRSILERLANIEENPVTRARRFVELQVTPNRRGPGWDRHWRELEAYAEASGSWTDAADATVTPTAIGDP